MIKCKNCRNGFVFGGIHKRINRETESLEREKERQFNLIEREFKKDKKKKKEKKSQNDKYFNK